MFIEAILFGIILGRLRSGKISGLEKINFKGLKYILLLFIFDFILRIFVTRGNSPIALKLFHFYPVFSMGIYLFMIVLLDLNKHLSNIRIIQSGFVLNYLPMILNGGKMPVSEEALISLGKLEEVGLMKKDLMLGHKLIDEGTRFSLFADTMPLKIFFPKVISIGDIVIFLGLVLFISHYMAKGRKIEKKS